MPEKCVEQARLLRESKRLLWEAVCEARRGGQPAKPYQLCFPWRPETAMDRFMALRKAAQKLQEVA